MNNALKDYFKAPEFSVDNTYQVLKSKLKSDTLKQNPWFKPLLKIAAIFVIGFSAPNNSRLPDYFRADISAIYNFKISNGIKAEVGASAWNILNQTNIINRFYTLDSDDSVVEINNRSLKFTSNLSFRINF